MPPYSGSRTGAGHPMVNFARRPESDRRDVFRVTAQRMRVHEAIVEKDFWVCWALDYLFQSSPWRDDLAFKGGTSLSKAYNAIYRQDAVDACEKKLVKQIEIASATVVDAFNKPCVRLLSMSSQKNGLSARVEVDVQTARGAMRQQDQEQVVYESGIEAAFADELEKNPAIKVYAKLPRWFTVPTPLGSYIPDWAVLVQTDEGDRVYLVVETKAGLYLDDLRDREKAKIACGREHFKALATGDDPARYKLARKLEDVLVDL